MKYDRLMLINLMKTKNSLDFQNFSVGTLPNIDNFLSAEGIVLLPTRHIDLRGERVNIKGR